MFALDEITASSSNFGESKESTKTTKLESWNISTEYNRRWGLAGTFFKKKDHI